MLFYAKVRWRTYEGKEEVVDEVFFVADDYKSAVTQIEDRFRDVIAMSLYAFDDAMLCVSDYKDYLEEGRKAVV